MSVLVQFIKQQNMLMFYKNFQIPNDVSYLKIIYKEVIIKFTLNWTNLIDWSVTST